MSLIVWRELDLLTTVEEEKLPSVNHPWLWSVYYTRPDRVYAEVRSSVSVFTTRPSEVLNLTVSTKAKGHMAVWMWRPLVCRHQRVKGEQRLSSAALISSNDLLSKSQLLLRHDQRGRDNRGLFGLRCSSLQPLHCSLLDERPGLRLGVKTSLNVLFLNSSM